MAERGAAGRPPPRVDRLLARTPGRRPGAALAAARSPSASPAELPWRERILQHPRRSHRSPPEHRPERKRDDVHAPSGGVQRAPLPLLRPARSRGRNADRKPAAGRARAADRLLREYARAPRAYRAVDVFPRTVASSPRDDPRRLRASGLAVRKTGRRAPA